MKKLCCILLFLTLTFFAQAGKQPASIDEAVLYFEKKWNTKQKESFKTLPEKKAVEEHDLSTGIFIRSRWLSNKKDTLLLSQFKKLGIDEPHNMSAIIIRSLHRKLNNTPIELEEQVIYFKEYWKPFKACEEKAFQAAGENYKKFSIGDSITIFMDVDSKFGTRNAILHECLETEWSFDYKNDLLIKGIITSKRAEPEKKNCFFKVKISYLSSDNTTILFKKAKVTDEMEFGLRYLLVKGRN